MLPARLWLRSAPPRRKETGAWNRINVIVAGKANSWQWLSIEEAKVHCNAGIGIWEWASTDGAAEPDVVMACAGDVPTLEMLAAVQILKHYIPDLKVRVVNIVDLMTLQPKEHHPHGLSDREFDALFTRDKPVIFAYHGYPWALLQPHRQRAPQPLRRCRRRPNDRCPSRQRSKPVRDDGGRKPRHHNGFLNP